MNRLMRKPMRFRIPSCFGALMHDMDLDPSWLFAQIGVSPDLLSRGDLVLTAQNLYTAARVLDAAIGPDKGAIAFAKACSAESGGVHVAAALCCANALQALQRLSNYWVNFFPVTSSVSFAQGIVHVDFEFYGQGDEGLPHSTPAGLLSYALQIVRLGVRRRVAPVSVELAVAPAKLSYLDNFFGCPVKRGTRNRISFSTVDALQPFLTQNQVIWKALEPELIEQASEFQETRTVAEDVRRILYDLLPQGINSAEAVARKLNASKRTLQRWLAAEGLTFIDVLTSTRCSMAKELLEQSDTPVEEIGWLLTYENSASFVRAFKGWTGVTPGAFRKTGQQPSPS